MAHATSEGESFEPGSVERRTGSGRRGGMGGATVRDVVLALVGGDRGSAAAGVGPAVRAPAPRGLRAGRAGDPPGRRPRRELRGRGAVALRPPRLQELP